MHNHINLICILKKKIFSYGVVLAYLSTNVTLLHISVFYTEITSAKIIKLDRNVTLGFLSILYYFGFF